jgi:hypothetical protein
MVTATRVTVIRVDGSQQRVNAHFPPFNHFAWLYCKYCVDETSLLYNPQSVGQFHERGLKREYLKRLTLYYTVIKLTRLKDVPHMVCTGVFTIVTASFFLYVHLVQAGLKVYYFKAIK